MQLGRSAGLLSQNPVILLCKAKQQPVAVARRRPCQPTCSAFDRINNHAHPNGVPAGETAGIPTAFPKPQETAQSVSASTQSAPESKEEAKKMLPKEFTNTNRFWVPLDVIEAFEREWRHREAAMKEADGFLGLSVDRKGEEYTVSSRWASIPQWEAWSCTNVARRSHMPLGVLQYVPKKGEGFPDDFAPFKDMTQAVNPKY